MRLPRRVPWANIGELDQLCAWIYDDEHDLEAKVHAVNRDRSQPPSSSYLALRHAYATALIRLVNGLVDPLQLGTYARSISSIAAQLGLPAWLVELRHAATHEDLPSVHVLRDAAREALTWLLHNYFLPTLNPAAPPPASAPRAPLRPLAPLLKRYKALQKAAARDVSLAPQLAPEITRVLRDAERWVADARLAAPGAGWDDGDAADTRERWALDRLCDELLARGALVPVSKKKRAPARGVLVPAPALLSLWTPLLTQLRALHTGLPAALVARITTHLLAPATPADATAEHIAVGDAAVGRDVSYDRCVAAWASWLVNMWGTDTGADAADEDGDAADLRRADVVVGLATALGPTSDASSDEFKVAHDLLKALCKDHPPLQRASALVTGLPAASVHDAWQDNDIARMRERLAALRALATPSPSLDAPHASAGSPTSSVGVMTALPRGWRRVSEHDGWRPSPIGVFIPCATSA
ncbi:predicted protein [Postia placenta Mad-698-R]|uniref:Las1-domain-containing protein n=1 Tax=Postia placenta MAD-698-R-SB12 TaxID=670580 RepID=A0A1X6NHH4_9APHY|nr:hypothetical protein POSPLADRAFT_1030832 [Postia placenta MAD-698-R-SB12]EED82871.1 predicted protein [Postia placenta Mad-698-R]OSX67970.1 hypothetical protein POSPLADRAFT_1030832 [Postia placenta MAD-698-R-SB12]